MFNIFIHFLGGKSMRFILSIVLLVVCLALPANAAQPVPLRQALLNAAPDLNSQALDYALLARANGMKDGVIKRQDILSIIDYSLPSTQKRMWTFDLEKRRLLFHEFVAHGMNSGENRTVKFALPKDSHMSMYGLYVTDVTYIGKNGYSMRLKGLDKGYNDTAYDRAVVFHGAPYVNEEMIRKHGRLGRSWGCPAVRKEIATPMIDVMKNGSPLFAYYPDANWLKNSHYLGNGQSAKPILRASAK
jgi:L,D-transpeptidase catalytic domain